MAYCTGSNVRILLIIAALLRVCVIAPTSPDHFWPLNSKSYGFDVVTETESAAFYGEKYLLRENGFLLDGFSYVTIDMKGSGNTFTLLFSLSLDVASQGNLVQYRDFSGSVQLTAKLEGGKIEVTMKRSTCTATLKSISVPISSSTTFQVMLVAESNKWKILINKDDEVSTNKRCLLSFPGQLRFGRGFDHVKSITGIVSELVLFNAPIQARCVQSRYSFQLIPVTIPSEPEDQFKMGYFLLKYRGSIPNCVGCSLATKYVYHRHDCGSICLQYFYCLSFVIEKSAERYYCYLYTNVYMITAPKENTWYYVTKKVDS